MKKLIGIIGAMETEVRALKEVMRQNGSLQEEVANPLCEGDKRVFYKGSINGVDVVLTRSGVGKVNAALCASYLILKFNVTAIINTGIAGALADGLGVFDIVLSSSSLYHDMDAREFGYKETIIPQMKVSNFTASTLLLDAASSAFNALYPNGEHKVVKGVVTTGDCFVSDKTKKEYIKEITSASCVEMEGAGIAHACYLYGIPYLIIRCISDMADESAKSIYSFNEDAAAKESSSIVLETLKRL